LEQALKVLLRNQELQQEAKQLWALPFLHPFEPAGQAFPLLHQDPA